MLDSLGSSRNSIKCAIHVRVGQSVSALGAVELPGLARLRGSCNHVT
jgi:hypothetical protein